MRIIQVSFILIIFFSVILHEIKGNLVSEFIQFLKRLIQSNCSCSQNECCSKWGYCGRTDAYCGQDCQSGPCKISFKTIHTNFDITSEVFACIFTNIDNDLRDRRLKGFKEAMKHMKWQPVNSTEAAIFLAHVSHETDGLKTLAEYCSKQGTCNNYQTSWCSIEARPNKKYYGRGWFQLSYPCNYYNAGKALGFDLLNNPDLVSKIDKIAALTAIWYFKETEMNQLAQQDNFGGTTRKLNEYECSGKAGYYMQAERIQTYHRVRKCFDLPEATTNLTC
ncbi:unnamed protein product [Rotaria sordida]|uniref:Chitin-binding type-1 domain-containing protein n=1 Tax=Rotaria sordida TaxID=392033 RepID=A0A815PID3_9BILA|nr:unnamed protein product [Rotaria sordida]CAF1449541.1 unnamed protein product [Rotaria sordida]CAF3570849.1 unnamed protein product [Rotaria sordida]CAF3834184.1 unnamed protein product [Rotaria sordida]